MKTFKRILISVLFVVLLSNAGWGQLLIEAEFDGLTLGDLDTQGGWVQNGSGTDVQVSNAATIIYDEYNGGDDEYLTISSTDGTDPHKVFGSQMAATSIWFSFLIQVSSFSGTGEYFFTLRNTDNTEYLARIFIKDNSGELQFGTSKGSETASNYSGQYNYGETYLVVGRYEWNTANGTDDNFYVWINPEMSEDLDIVNSANYSIEGGSDPNFGSQINSVMLHQRGANSPIAAIEGIRVSANSDLAEGWTQLGCFIKNFYSKPLGNLNLKSTWGHKTNGKGSHCMNFTRRNRTFYIRNSASHTIAANWTVSGTNSKVVLGDGTNACTFTVPSANSFSGTINVSNNGTLKLQNTTLPTLGTLNSGSTVEYNQSSSVNLAAATYNNLTINNSAGVTLSGAVNVNGTLSLTNGKITTDANVLTLGSSTSSLGNISPETPTSSSYIVGNFERWFAASTVTDVYFPVGTALRYLPAIISYTVAPSTGGKLKVSGHIDDPLADNTSNLDDGGYTIDRYSSSAWWQFTPTTLDGGTYSLNLQGEEIAGTDAVNYYKLRMLKRATGSQTWALSGTHVDATGSNTNPLIKRTGLTGFSEFGIGGNSADGNVLSDKPLPVILSSLSSSVINRNVRLNWTTSTETNNSGFNLERGNREQGIGNSEYSWIKLGFIEGKGTKNTSTSYSFEDKNLQSGKYKYRLKQIDYNGSYEYFELNGEVEVGVPKKFDMSQNYPNPFNPVTKINFDLPENGLVNIRLYDMLGREVAVIVNEVRSAGYHTVQFDASKLSSGVYFYKMNSGKFNGIKKMAVIK